MTLADKIFKRNLMELLQEDWEPDNRATWEDGSPIATKRVLAVVNRYDLSKEFPALTLRPTPIKTCFDEDDWIYRQRSNNVNDLKPKIWDAWAFKKTVIKFSTSFPFIRVFKKGSIGNAYGYQIAKPVFGYDNQMDYILEELQKNPSTRRAVIEMWNVDDLKHMKLPPCAHHLQFLVKNNRLNLILKQRSNDFLVANNFNVCQYALLVHMVARHCGFEVGILTHVIGDMHIYNKHMDQALEIMRREELPAPTFWLNPNVTNFYEFTRDDVKLIYPLKHPQLTFDVAE